MFVVDAPWVAAQVTHFQGHLVDRQGRPPESKRDDGVQGYGEGISLGISAKVDVEVPIFMCGNVVAGVVRPG
jgi:hypothetical protein